MKCSTWMVNITQSRIKSKNNLFRSYHSLRIIILSLHVYLSDVSTIYSLLLSFSTTIYSSMSHNELLFIQKCWTFTLYVLVYDSLCIRKSMCRIGLMVTIWKSNFNLTISFIYSCSDSMYLYWKEAKGKLSHLNKWYSERIITNRQE